MNIISKLTSGITKYALMLIALISTVYGVYRAGKSKGKDEVEIKSTKEALARAIDAKEVDNEVSKMDESVVDSQLDKWMRD